MPCGNCYREIDENRNPRARVFRCASCGESSAECVLCACLGVERGVAPVTTCARCSLEEEVDGFAEE